MHISVEINGVETKWTCLSSFAVVLFALVQLIGIILLFAHVGWDTMPVVDGVLNMYDSRSDSNFDFSILSLFRSPRCANVAVRCLVLLQQERFSTRRH